jgi:hypothetical protein
VAYRTNARRLQLRGQPRIQIAFPFHPANAIVRRKPRTPKSARSIYQLTPVIGPQYLVVTSGACPAAPTTRTIWRARRCRQQRVDSQRRISRCRANPQAVAPGLFVQSKNGPFDYADISLLPPFRSERYQWYRWLHQAPHRFDSSTVARSRPLWGVLTLALLSGTTVVCAIGA